MSITLAVPPLIFFFYCSRDLGDLHSFPTRRSSDLDAGHEVGHRVAGIFHDEKSPRLDRKSTRLNSSHVSISYAVFCLKKKKQKPGDEKRRANHTPQRSLHRTHTPTRHLHRHLRRPV